VRDLKQELGTTAPVFLWKTINPGHYDCDSAPSSHGPIASFEAYQAEVLRHPASDLPVSDKHRYWYTPSIIAARPCYRSSSPCPPALAVRFLIPFFFFLRCAILGGSQGSTPRPVFCRRPSPSSTTWWTSRRCTCAQTRTRGATTASTCACRGRWTSSRSSCWPCCATVTCEAHVAGTALRQQTTTNHCMKGQQ
jgi:hypothetical protein